MHVGKYEEKALENERAGYSGELQDLFFRAPPAFSFPLPLLDSPHGTGFRSHEPYIGFGSTI
jgi:hypothetical protein